MTAQHDGAGTAEATTVGDPQDRSPDRTQERYLDAGEQRRTVRLTRTGPAIAIALVVAIYAAAAASGMMPLQWVSHVDGQGSVQYSAHWPLVTVTLAAAAIAFLVGWFLAREHAQAGHWHDLEKGILVAAVVYTAALPKARADRQTPRY